jgi:ABC-type uncharacterized transport system permease subunit
MRRLGNRLVLLGAFVGLFAAVQWSAASLTAADFNLDSMRDDLIAISEANMWAAGVSSASAFLIAAGEALRMFGRWGHR